MYSTLVDVIKKLDKVYEKGITFILNDNVEQYYSYSDLYTSAVYILGNLQKAAVKPGDEMIFQISGEKEFICTFWACLLGGIIPVPLSIGNNDAHRKKLFKVWNMLKNPYFITEANIYESLKKFSSTHEAYLDTLDKNIEKTLFIENMYTTTEEYHIHNAASSDIAFIQFSSGSTGTPKGVVLTHQNLLTNLSDLERSWEIGQEDSMLSWLPLTHDMGLIAVHLTGIKACLRQFIMPTGLFVRNPTLWMKKASEHKITQLYSPNFGYKHFLSFYSYDIAYDWDLSHVRIIINGAEPISSGLCDEFLRKMKIHGLNKKSMTPAYGLAEATVGVSTSPVGEEYTIIRLDRSCLKVGQTIRYSNENSIGFIDVGYPFENCSVRICDEYSRVLGELVIGHIHIKGNNVTGGYYNDSEATSKAITSNGWLDTGDLGFLRNGRVVITGRAKDVIFINGQNFYPHDIEEICANIIGDKSRMFVACGIHKKEEDNIVIFVLYKKDIESFMPLAKNLKRHIGEYMGIEVKEVIPVKKIPKTTSGKVQRYNLVEAYLSGQFDDIVGKMEKIKASEKTENCGERPSNEVDEKVLAIFKEILQDANISYDTSFFEANGNSLNATVLAAKINRHFNVEIPVSEIFKLRTVKEISEYIRLADKTGYTPIEAVGGDGVYTLSSIQKRMFAISNYETIGLSNNIPVIKEIKGALDRELLQNAFSELVKRHEILRTSFQYIDGYLFQRVHKDIDLKVEYKVYNQIEINDIVKEFVQTFDLTLAPLLRVQVAQLSEHRYLLMFDIHHIICDGISLGILISELNSLYKGQTLPKSRIQYKDYVAWQDNLFELLSFKKQEEYWLKKLGGELPVLDIPTDYPRLSVQSFEGAKYEFFIDGHITNKLRTLMGETGVTLYMLLLAVYNILLSKITGIEDIIVGSAISGRTHTDLEKLVGVLINTLPMRNYPQVNKTFIEFLGEVKSNTLEAFENQLYPFEELTRKLGGKRDFTKNPVFNVMFTMENFEIPSIEIGDTGTFQYVYEERLTHTDFCLLGYEYTDSIRISLHYCKDLYALETAKAMAKYFMDILIKVLENPQIKLSDIELLSQEEKRKLFEEMKDRHSEGISNQNSKADKGIEADFSFT